MLYHFLILLAISVVDEGLCQHYLHQPTVYNTLQPIEHIQPPISNPNYAHRAVIENSIRESKLPLELLKSHRFYSDPKTAEGLAKESWFTSKEMPVYDREAEKIPRNQVHKILSNAGLIRK